MIQVNNVSKSFGGQVLFEDINFIINPGERLGLVGRNGTGKSTLFKMILGTEDKDSGSILIPKNYKIGSLEQHIKFTEPTVLEECVQCLSEEEQYDHYKAEKLLTGLGFSNEDYHADPHSFSGGYQIRINLVKALLQNPQLLLLDEPTNYLDITSIAWLGNFLKQYPGEIIIITHDRDFMDNVATHIAGIHREAFKKVEGNTEKYYEQVFLEEEIHEKTRMNLDKKKKELQSFVDRFGAKASKAAQAQSKAKQIEKLGSLEKLSGMSQMNLNFEHAPIPAKTLMSVKKISFQYSKDDDILFSNLSFDVLKNDRLAIIGKNGKGKSTLLNILGGELKQTEGELVSHHGLKIGHFGQTNIDRLHGNNTIIEEIGTASTGLTNGKIRSVCGAMMFSSDLAEKKIKVLSGGERSRVQMGKIIASPSNILLLDEPTNHLDMESIEILTQSVRSYPGAVVVVTHDERMLKALATKLIIFRNGNAELFEGKYKEFLQKIGWDSDTPTKSAEPAKPKLSYKEKKAQRAILVKEKSKNLNPLKKKVESLEKLISDSEQELTKVNTALLEASQADDGSKISELSIRVGDLQGNIDDAFGKLEVESEKLEKLASEFDQKLALLV